VLVVPVAVVVLSIAVHDDDGGKVAGVVEVVIAVVVVVAAADDGDDGGGGVGFGGGMGGAAHGGGFGGAGDGLLIFLPCSYTPRFICFESLRVRPVAQNHPICRVLCTKRAPNSLPKESPEQSHN
jgi:hypothetical protein